MFGLRLFCRLDVSDFKFSDFGTGSNTGSGDVGWDVAVEVGSEMAT